MADASGTNIEWRMGNSLNGLKAVCGHVGRIQSAETIVRCIAFHQEEVLSNELSFPKEVLSPFTHDKCSERMSYPLSSTNVLFQEAFGIFNWRYKVCQYITYTPFHMLQSLFRNNVRHCLGTN